MRNLLRIILLGWLAIVTIGCRIIPVPLPPDPPQPPTPPSGETKQTLLFYLSGQSLLSYFRTQVTQEIQKAIRENTLYNNRLMVYIQPSNSLSLLIEYSYDYAQQAPRADTLRRYRQCSSIDKEHIKEVLSDVAHEAPASCYGMVVGSHGGGWVPKEFTSLNENEESSESDNSGWARTLAQHPPHDWLHKSPGADPTRWLGEHRGESTDLSTWAEALEEAPIELDYLIFDACFMSNIESLYELRNAARYIVASPCEIMGRGINYFLGLPTLLITDERDHYDLSAFCKAFYDFYSTTTETRQSGCIACCCCEELEALAETTAQILRNNPNAVDPASLQPYEGISKLLFHDFRQYIELAASDAAQLEAFEAQFERTFPAEMRLHTPAFYSGYNGRMIPVNYYSGVSSSALSTKYPNAYQASAWSRRMQGE